MSDTWSKDRSSVYRLLPSVDELVRSETGRELTITAGTKAVTRLARLAISEIRDELDTTPPALPTRDGLLAAAESRLRKALQHSREVGIQAVINATGVLIHTNLGRAPLSETAKQKLLEASGYCGLEYELSTGLRGKRGARVESLICQITGAEAALVVNNCAAAAFFVLSVFAAGREVVMSRGEMVEIGGDFRIPDVLARSGVTLREVGTTNRTKLADYENAFCEQTAMILSVHPSNYRIVGFASSPTVSELAELARSHNILLYQDAGSGAVSDLTSFGIDDEPLIGSSLEAGVDVVTFSGDKLLGGPQSGLIVGRREAIDRLRRDPLYRALRVDKLCLAALDATLDAHARECAFDEVPILRMLAESVDSIGKRAETLIGKLNNPQLAATITTGKSAIGGGAAPLSQPDTILVLLDHAKLSSTELAARLRGGRPPVITRIVNDKVAIDLRTVSGKEEAQLLTLLNSI